MTLGTVLEIYTNPFDLDFVIGKNPHKPGIWGLMISRGPEHHGKLLIDGEGFASKQEAIDSIAGVLKVCLEKGEETFKKKDAMNALTEQMVVQIKKELEANEACSTCTWLVLLQNEEKFAIALADWDSVIVQVEGKEATLKMIKENIPRLTQEVADKFTKRVETYYTPISAS